MVLCKGSSSGEHCQSNTHNSIPLQNDVQQMMPNHPRGSVTLWVLHFSGWGDQHDVSVSKCQHTICVLLAPHMLQSWCGSAFLCYWPHPNRCGRVAQNTNSPRKYPQAHSRGSQKEQHS